MNILLWSESEKSPDNEYPPVEQMFGNKYEIRCSSNFQNESVYQRDYHIQKVLNEMKIPGEDRDKIELIFQVMEEFISQVDKER